MAAETIGGVAVVGVRDDRACAAEPWGERAQASDQIVGLGRWLAGRAGVAAVAIDGPYHGDRVPAAVPVPVYQALIAEQGIDAVVNRIIAVRRPTASRLL